MKAGRDKRRKRSERLGGKQLAGTRDVLRMGKALAVKLNGDSTRV